MGTPGVEAAVGMATETGGENREFGRWSLSSLSGVISPEEAAFRCCCGGGWGDNDEADVINSALAVMATG